MRIIVLSDTHRSCRTFFDIVEKHWAEASYFVHLGDGERDVERVLDCYPGLPLIAVSGNCDFASGLPQQEFLIQEEVKILCTHGHVYGVKESTERLEAAARQFGCHVALYGHTHVSAIQYRDGIYLMNPGSPSCPVHKKPSYGIIDITPQGVVPFLVEL